MHETLGESVALNDILDLIPRLLDDVHRSLNASPYTRYLDTNANISLGPLASEARSIVDRFTVLSRRLHNVLDSISDSVQKVDDSIRGHGRLISTATRLPSDILASIFVRALPPVCQVFADSTMDYSYVQYMPEGRDIALNLAQVCRTWREVALNFPRLWNHMTLSLEPEALHESSPRTDELIRRAGANGAPIELVLWANSQGLDFHRPERLREARRGVLAPFEGRCSALSIHLRDGSVIWHLLHFLARMSGLTRLHFYVDIPDDYTISPPQYIELTHLSPENFTYRLPVRTARFFTPDSPWENLITVQLDTDTRFPVDQAACDVLVACPHLREFYLQATGENTVAPLRDEYMGVDWDETPLPTVAPSVHPGSASSGSRRTMHPLAVHSWTSSLAHLCKHC